MNSRLQTQLVRAAQVVADSEKFLVGVLAVRAEKFAQAQPYDPCAVGMANYLKKKAAGPNALISRAEFKQVYGKLYSQNSLFGEEFATELGTTAGLLAPQRTNRSPLEGNDLISEAASKTDPILRQGLDSAFDSSIPYKTYSPATAVSAEKSCFHELNRQGLPPRKVTVVAGRADLLLCQANYETPKGISSVLIPVEIRDAKALLPTIFLTARGCLDLNATDLEEHLVSSAGKSYQIDTQKVLEVLSSAKNPKSQPLSEVEKIVMRVNAKKETPANHFDTSIFQEIDKKAEYFKFPEAKIPQELQSISDSLISQAGQAEFLFGKKSIDTGTQLVRQILSDLGHRSVQIRIASVRAEGPVYVAALDSRTAVKIPVKMGKNSVTPPGMCLVAGKVFSLNADGLKAAQQEVPALEVQASASPNYDLKSGHLLNQLKVAMLSENYLKAEDILNVLDQRGDKKALTSAQTIYRAGLKGELLPELSKCASSYTSSVSSQRICAHTNLPIDKVYQDQDGNCHPKYRQGMSESFDGAALIDYKVIL